MNVIKKVVVFAVVLCTVSLHAMKRQRTEIVEESCSNKKQALEEKPCLETFVFLIQKQILTPAIIDESPTIIETASTFESLSRTCKAFNEHFNTRSAMLNLVKEISTHFTLSNQYVARILSIKKANEIHDTHLLLYAYMRGAEKNPEYVIQSLKRLENAMGIDVNYTYDQDRATPLAIALKEPHQDNQSSVKKEIVDWLLKRNARIAPITKDGDSAASIALYQNDFESLDQFLAHKDFNPDYVGKNGNTLLHDCLIIFLKKEKCTGCNTPCGSSNIIAIIKHLLNKKTDVSIANHAGKTSLMLAKQLNYTPITILFENAEITATSA